MQETTRKKSAVVRAERYKTGGGTSTAPDLTPAEQKVKQMILVSVDRNESFFDSDIVLPSTLNVGSIITCLPTEEQNVHPATEHRDGSYNNILLENQAQENESTRKEVSESEVSQLKEWNPKAFETKKYPVFSSCNNTLLENQGQENEPITKEDCESELTQWKEWNPKALKTKKHPVLSKPKEKRPFDKLTEEKLEIAKLQKKLVTEELEQKLIQRKILEKESEHKDAIHELEKQHLLLKI